jgi:hypothetical protein
LPLPSKYNQKYTFRVQAMLPTYPAILRDGRLEWGHEGCPPALPNQPIPVHVTVLAPEALIPVDGVAMASALGAIAAAGGPAGVDDPVDWQRNSRIDRSLPGRSE